MRVALGSVEVSEEERKAIRAYFGRSGSATRNEIRRFVVDTGLSVLREDLLNEYIDKQEQKSVGV